MFYDLILFTALDREVSTFARSLSRVLVDDSFALWAGRLQDAEILLVRTGIGPAAAHEAAERVFARVKAAAALSIGTCGALRESLQAGELIVATESIDPEEDIAWPSAPELLARLESAAVTSGPHHVAPLASVSQAIGTVDEKRDVATRTGAVAVDMESAALARAASHAKVPFAAVRAVLDLATEAFPTHPDGPLVDEAGRPNWTRLLALAARDPMLPMGLTRLWRRERVARASLDTFLQELCRAAVVREAS